MDDSFDLILTDLLLSLQPPEATESKLQRNARHIDELQQIVLRMLEQLIEMHER